MERVRCSGHVSKDTLLLYNSVNRLKVFVSIVCSNEIIVCKNNSSKDSYELSNTHLQTCESKNGRKLRYLSFQFM